MGNKRVSKDKHIYRRCNKYMEKRCQRQNRKYAYSCCEVRARSNRPIRIFSLTLDTWRISLYIPCSRLRIRKKESRRSHKKMLARCCTLHSQRRASRRFKPSLTIENRFHRRRFTVRMPINRAKCAQIRLSHPYMILFLMQKILQVVYYAYEMTKIDKNVFLSY